MKILKRISFFLIVTIMLFFYVRTMWGLSRKFNFKFSYKTQVENTVYEVLKKEGLLK